MVREPKSRSTGALVRTDDRQTLPQVYLSRVPEIGDALPPEAGGGFASRLKWIVSTCIVGVAGVCVIAVAMYASMDFERDDGIISSIQRASVTALQPKQVGRIVHDQPDIAFGQKTDRIKLTAKGVTTSHIIHDSVVRRRDATEFIEIQPYVLIEAALATENPQAVAIPKFDPFELYANKTPVSDGAPEGEPRQAASDNVALSFSQIRVNRLSIVDNRAIGVERAEQFVAEAAAVLAEAGTDFESAPEEPVADPDAAQIAEPQDDPLDANTTVVEKTPESAVDPAQSLMVTSARVRAGDTLYAMLADAGAAKAEAEKIVAAMSAVPGATQLKMGQELRFVHPRGLAGDQNAAPLKISLHSGDEHIVSVSRSGSGEYAATREDIQLAALTLGGERRYSSRATLYSSIFHAALARDLPHDLVMQLLRILAYDVDFKQKVGFGDTIRFFFDIEREPSGVERPGDLLFASITVDGEIYTYYRYRTPDGKVDFYDAEGSNSRKFLMREPVKGARFTSGYGFRRHPILGTRRMHTGVDWAAPHGTPILAPGDGTVTFVGRKGGYGNHIRINHGNGYTTTYSHLQRFAENIRKGVKVQQGQVIGRIGSTGMSTGPHLHYEVIVDGDFTDPMKIATGTSRQLKGRLLAEFKRERDRIEGLMRRAPVKTQVAAVNE